MPIFLLFSQSNLKRTLAELIGRSTKSSSAILKGLDAKGVLAWHGTSRTDPAQYYSLP